MREAPDPLNLTVSRRPHESNDRVPNDWIEAVAIFLAIVGMTGAGITLYHLSQQVG